MGGAPRPLAATWRCRERLCAVSHCVSPAFAPHGVQHSQGAVVARAIACTSLVLCHVVCACTHHLRQLCVNTHDRPSLHSWKCSDVTHWSVRHAHGPHLCQVVMCV